MTDSLKEQLSACLDGELPEAELDLLLKRLERDPELRQSLGRYALIGQALQGRVSAASPGFASKVMAGLDGEAFAPQTAVREVSARALRWLKPAVGLAVAAGVATVAIVSLQPAAEVDQPILTASLPSDTPTDYTVPVMSSSSNPALIQATRLTNYVVAHSEYSSPLGRRTVLSGVLADDEESAEPVDETVVETAADPVQ
jgi:sigma-E factor negative regulatory protein RseA